MQRRAILVHGMGRTPLSMLILAARLRAAGYSPSLFAYIAAFEAWNGCLSRLEKFIKKQVETDDYIVVAHSLGAVLTRAVIPRLAHPPRACFFLAPPSQACLAARTFADWRLYRWITGEMGQLLAQPAFMEALPIPAMPTKIYAGSGGPVNRWLPFWRAPNDGVLMVSETSIASIPVLVVPNVHTFLMNARAVDEDIVQMSDAIMSSIA